MNYKDVFLEKKSSLEMNNNYGGNHNVIIMP